MVVKVQRSIDGRDVLICDRTKKNWYLLPYHSIKNLRMAKGGKAYYKAHIEGTQIVLDIKINPRKW